MRKYQSASAAAFVVVICALVGGFFGRDALSAQDQVPDQYKVFTAAVNAIESTYVGEVPSDRLVYSAIAGMLQTLDPHSSFYDPRSYAQMRERQEGRYYGLGISINVIDGDVTIANVFEDSPAYEKGLRRGDVIAKIEALDTKGWTIEQAVSRLRGPKGTSVPISLRRGGYDKLIDLQVRRDEVHIKTVPAAVMLDATTGVIWFKGDFGENSDEEIGAALKSLTQKGMKRLIFDLRDNPGGSLPTAIAVANRFLPRGDLIVYTRGRTQNSDQDYRATENSDYLKVPMVTLVNRRSASASEIVSGALQDHDRSLIVGETTFGKALVQSVYRVAQNAGASITTARYYTPSGRLIQRPWDGSFDEYMTYTLRDQDANRAHKPEDLKYTDAGRKVYSGGGVEPDFRVDGPMDGFNPDAARPRDREPQSVRRLLAAVFADGRSADRAEHLEPGQKSRSHLRRHTRDGRRVQGTGEEVADSVRRGQLAEGFAVHQGADSQGDRHRPVWFGGGVPESRQGRPAASARVDAVSRGSAASGARPNVYRPGAPLEPHRPSPRRTRLGPS
jgi:carboxyl-terminal processing protease